MSNEDIFNNIKQFKQKLDSISPSFCTAKWLQSTILLYNGETHSCHHPSRHKISLDRLKDNPSQIHNTPIKIFAREEMLKGIQTKECDYCWRIENMKTEHLSDRVYKSASNWGQSKFDEVVASGNGQNIIPNYVEVAFETTCNFACMYCTPDVSSRWMEDAESNGPYKLSSMNMHDVVWLKDSGKLPIHRDEYNPYIDAFWKWWPELYPNLHTFRITGGEPLLSKHTWSVFNWIKENPNPNLEFAINTNLNVPKKLIDKLIEEIKSAQDKVKEIKIFTSLEATGNDAEYIRYGMNYSEFISNLNYVMSELPNVRVVIMTTINALSIFTFKDFLNEILILRAKYIKNAGHSTLGLSINYLRWPQFMDIRILNKEKMEQYLNDIVNFVLDHNQKTPEFKEGMFYLEEIDQIQRLKEYALQPCPNREQLVKDFNLFFDQYDARRNLNRFITFPQLDKML